MGEGGVGIGVTQVGQLDAVGMHLQVARAAPRIEHTGCHGIGTQRACGEKLLSRAPGTDSCVGFFDHGGCTSVLKGCNRQLRHARRLPRLNLRIALNSDGRDSMNPTPV